MLLAARLDRLRRGGARNIELLAQLFMVRDRRGAQFVERVRDLTQLPIQ